jgi:hypothetical protein
LAAAVAEGDGGRGTRRGGAGSPVSSLQGFSTRGLAMRIAVWGLMGAALLVGAPAARAVEPYLVSVGVLGGLGGPLDADDPDPGIDHPAVQVDVGLLTEPRTLVVLRLGRVEIDEPLGFLAEPRLDYATISGEYRLFDGWYDSGIFLGLGAYRLGSEGEEEETAVGLTVGVTGDFELTRWLSAVAELSGHWADLEENQLFGLGHAGLAVRF